MENQFDRALKKLRENIISDRLLVKGDSVLCALSGGADSASLMVFLVRLSDDLGIRVCAAHLNHGIRGEEAERDEEYCISLCKSLGVKLEVGKADVPCEAKKRGLGLEECAREIRYSFLNEAASKLGCDKICTAHHADDNIETVLLHMIRGCGLTGLTGISAVRGNIIRPLLSFKKSELVAALDEAGIEYVHDSSNDETDYTRNYIRHNILPHIYKLNESADKGFGRMCASLTLDSEYILSQAKNVPCDAPLSVLRELDAAVLSRYITLRYEELAGSGKRLENVSQKLISDAVKIKNGSVRYDVTGGVTVFISHSGIHFEKTGNTNNEGYFLKLTEGENNISHVGYKILITSDKKVADEWQKVYKKSILWCVNFDKISKDGNLDVAIRSRRQGDKYVFGGFERDVRRQMINYKIPVQKRAGVPCFCTEKGIFGVYGLPLADGMKALNGQKAVYIVCAEIK